MSSQVEEDFDGSDSSASTSSTVARYIMENALFSNTEIETAFMELMAAIKEADSESYDFLRRMAKQNSGFKASWRLVLIDVMLSMSLADLAEDDEIFELTVNSICSPRRAPGSEIVFKACVLAYKGTHKESRIEVIKTAVLGS